VVSDSQNRWLGKSETESLIIFSKVNGIKSTMYFKMFPEVDETQRSAKAKLVTSENCKEHFSLF
jgi:hypothetical protein